MIQRLETGRLQLREQLSPAYHRAGGEPLDFCLRTAQSLVDELGTLLRGEGSGDARADVCYIDYDRRRPSDPIYVILN